MLAHWWHPVASSKALNLFHWVMCTVSYRCIAMVIEMASKVGAVVIIVLFAVALAANGVLWSK